MQIYFIEYWWRANVIGRRVGGVLFIDIAGYDIFYYLRTETTFLNLDLCSA